MKKKTKDQCILESNLEKWANEERERLAARGKDDRFFVYAEPEINEGIIYGGDYRMKFNRDERVIDLVINSEEDSLIWDNVIDNVPARFVVFLTGKPDTFLYRISSNTSDKKEFYCFVDTDDESGELLPIGIDELSPLGAWKAEYFDELIC